MAVYREGYSVLESIQSKVSQVFTDACDEGAPVVKGDQTWKNIKMIKEWYGPNPESPELEVYKDEFGGYFDIMLMDEWAFSDRRKTEDECIEIYRVHYHKIRPTASLRSEFKNADGFIFIKQKR